MTPPVQKRKEIPTDTRRIIVKLFCEGKSLGKIGKIVGHSKSSVQYIVKMHGETGGLKSKPRSGRPTLINEISKRSIVRKVKENPKISAPKIANELQRELSISVSDETIRNVLRKNGYHGRVPRRKPLISEKNRIKRIQFAREHKDKDNSYWNQVMFTDESKYNIFGCDGKGKVWRKSNEEMKIKNLCATVKVVAV